MDTGYEKEPLNKFTHSVRAAQAVLQYGVGAMVDFPDQTLMTAAPETWEGSIVEIHDERLEKVLHVDFFGMPGSKDDVRYQSGIAYSRFPEWYFCPRCRAFKPLNEWINEYKMSPIYKKYGENDPYMIKHLKCPSCSQELVVARIITACGCGHIDDFPWVKWVHARNKPTAKSVCKNPKLRLTTSASSAEGLEGLTIKCENCNAKATLKGAFDKDGLRELDEKTGLKYGFTCSGRHPWKNTKESCNEYPHVLQRGSSSVYFPIKVSSLVIPPYSSLLTAKIQGSKFFSDLKKEITADIKAHIKAFASCGMEFTQEKKEEIIYDKIDEFALKIGRDIGQSADVIKPVLMRRWSGTSDDGYTTTSVKYRAEEYEALSGEVVQGEKNGEFLREETDITQYGLPHVKNISLIHKVREVQALVGFSRLEPLDEDSLNNNGKIKKVDIKEDDTNWYPGYDVRGEGIFIELDEEAIDLWRTKNPKIQHRVEQLNDNYSKSYYGAIRPRTITAKFLLLHTLSHLLMKQLSFECGYNIASIKERIYCSEASEGKSMSGILIYTASGDSEGTLGGLVRQGRADTFPAIFRKAIEGAVSCSNDPVCSLSMGQGRDSLNLSACYACTLVPETSCEHYNVFLDRGTVIGTYEEREIGFYSDYIYKNECEKIISQKGKAKKKEKNICITEPGTDLKNTEYKDIWENMLQFSTDKHEESIIKNLIDNVEIYKTAEKPCQGGTFQVVGDSNYYNVDLYWPKAKIMVFTVENREEYLLASKSDWKCYYLGSGDTSAEEIISVLKGK